MAATIFENRPSSFRKKNEINEMEKRAITSELPNSIIEERTEVTVS
jgi:hypothetical protein